MESITIEATVVVPLREDLAITSVLTRLSYLPFWGNSFWRGNVLLNDRVRRHGAILKPLRFKVESLLCEHDRTLFASLPNSVYDRVRALWIALGTTVLLHPDYLDEFMMGTDEQLLEAIVSFKKWFLKAAFSNLRLNSRGEVEAPQVLNLGTILKSLSKWMTFYGSFDVRTSLPDRVISPLPGGRSGEFQIFGWYGGHLSRWREPWKLGPSKHNVFCLAQIAGFGRALPPCPSEMAKSVGEATIKVLTTEPVYNRDWIPIFENAAELVARSMGRPTMNTHCSFSSSACYELTQEEGGTAKYLRDNVDAFQKSLWSRYFKDIPCEVTVKKIPFFKTVEEVRTSFELYDCFGRIALPRGANRYYEIFSKKGQGACRGRPELIIGEVLYRDIDWSSHNKRDISFYLRKQKPCCYQKGNDRFCCPTSNLGHVLAIPFNLDVLKDVGVITNEPFDGHLLNEVLGDMICLWAMTESLKFGHFEQNDKRVEPISDIALFSSPGVKTWIQDRPIPVEFMVLCEPGWKARPLTKNPVWMTIFEQICRHSVEESFHTDPRCGMGFESSYVLWDLLKYLKTKWHGNVDKVYFINADLKSATDYLPIDLLKSMWKGLFKGLGIDNNHPLNVFAGNQIKDFSISYRRNLMTHRCGSFMGTPLSFLGLSLYNLCVVEISSYITARSLALEPKFAMKLEHIQCSYDAIVGDDLLRITEEEHLCKNTIQIYLETNSRLSDGKFTVSEKHGILCENHVYKGTKETPFNYLDIIKARLMTDSCRYHSDNRSSIIGKGSALYSQIEWYSQTNREYTLVPRTALCMYEQTLKLVLEPWVYRLIENSGVHLPHSCGGLGFPMPWETIKSTYKDHLMILWYLSDDLCLEDYLVFHARAHHVHGNYRRGLEIDDYSHLFRETLAEKARIMSVFDPLVKDRLYSIQSVIKYYLTVLPDEIPRSSVTGLPQIRLMMNDVFERFGFIPVDVLLDQWDRYFCFMKAWKEGPVPVRYSFQKYLRNLHKFWDETLDQLCLKVTAEPKFKDLNELSWKVALRGKTVIHKDFSKESILASGPTLTVKLRGSKGSIEPRLHSKDAWEALAKGSLDSWLRNTVIDSATDEMDGMTGYLSRQLGLKLVDGKWVLTHDHT